MKHFFGKLGGFENIVSSQCLHMEFSKEPIQKSNDYYIPYKRHVKDITNILCG